MREIPPLHVLCLRVVGSHACSAEATFAAEGDNEEDHDKDKKKKKKDGKPPSLSPTTTTPSLASRLLRSFHQRPILVVGDDNDNDRRPPESDSRNQDEQEKKKDKPQTPRRLPPMYRTPCIGPKSARRPQANEVDLHHPFTACKVPIQSINNNKINKNSSFELVMEYGNPALDCLQCYIDALVELGRMDDGRMGRHFFDEWKANILIANTGSCLELVPPAAAATTTTKTSSSRTSLGRKRRRTLPMSPSASAAKTSSTTNDDASAAPTVNGSTKTPITATPTTTLGSLSLHNCSISTDTFGALHASGLGTYLAVLDLSGVGGLTDALLQLILPPCRQLHRLSIKNCRRVTSKGFHDAIVPHVASTLISLDIGGVYNIRLEQDDGEFSFFEAMDQKFTLLQELHASGLGWTDATVEQLTKIRSKQWKALSFSYSSSGSGAGNGNGTFPELSQTALRQALLVTAESLQALSLAFCETIVDNALLGMLGRNLPHIQYLDVRGNGSLTTLTGWYDGRVSADLTPNQSLTVLGRYSGLSEASVEETRRVHPMESADLVVILDGSGTGLGILSVLSTPTTTSTPTATT